ncbi:rhodanese-like domain-containing protein [Paenibacillus phoenicis]|uniref:Rhodanese-like domain-containing protein n=1 Tax=Paenibacillus phoenicis TaxID=554117 RepID=A0ABU5PRU1_9BACL|nr:rhodanese-like domain-containing protein [Paenibacillus phoenicis]MEA3572392.1 rhodanese-like domain-containing protein [Paenibacillus phoenicis]
MITVAFQPEKEITPAELVMRMKRGEQVHVLDVREPLEWAEGHISGAKHIPLGQLPERFVELDPEEELIVVCRSGGRSSLACELLSERGYRVVNMTGGMLVWQDEVE